MENEIRDKVRELSDLQYSHIGEIIDKMSERQIQYKEMLEKALNENNPKKVTYLEGLVDGINLMLEPLKKYYKA